MGFNIANLIVDCELAALEYFGGSLPALQVPEQVSTGLGAISAESAASVSCSRRQS
jgi:hypothetical protein